MIYFAAIVLTGNKTVSEFRCGKGRIDGFATIIFHLPNHSTAMKIHRKISEKRNRQTNLTAAFLISFSLLLASCYPEGPEIVSDYDVVGTSYDSTFNFAQVRTYALIDTVLVMQGNNSNRMYLSPALNNFVISQVENNLNRLGYTRISTISPDQVPDVVMQVSAFSNTSVGAYYDSWYNNWGWYSGWNSWYPGTGFGPGWYPSGVTYYYSVTTGTVLLEMINPAAADNTTQRLPVVWLGTLNGLLEFDDNNSNRERIANGIDRAFTQSPYLRRSL